jgi:hypothetical protein
MKQNGHAAASSTFVDNVMSNILADVSGSPPGLRCRWKVKAADLLAITKAVDAHHFTISNAPNLVTIPVVHE